MSKQEWDYPPQQARYRTLDTEQVPDGLAARADEKISSFGNRIGSFLWLIIRMMFGAVAGVAIVGIVWLAIKVLSS